MRQFARVIYKKIGLNPGDLLIILGIIILSLPLLWSLRSSYLQQIEDRKWTEESSPVDQKSVDQSSGEAPWPPTKIVINKMDLSAVIVEGYSDKDLNRGPMHLSGSANPGQVGNCCIAAHKEKWFKKLRILEPGDSVILRTHQKDYVYQVTAQKTVAPANLKVLKPTAYPTITLITCTGLPYGGSKHRLIVLGKLVEERRRS